MTIAFNGMTLSGQRSGVGFYTYNLLKALWAIDTTNEYLGWVLEDYSKNALFQSSNVHIDPVGISLQQPFKQLIWEHVTLPRELRKRTVDLFFSPSHTIPRSRLLNIPKVVTVHDLAFIHYPETKSRQFRTYMNWMIRYMVDHTDMMIVDSEQTRRDMMEILNAPGDRLKTVYLAASEHFRHPVSDDDLNRVRRQYGLGEHVILAVGDIEPRKNLARLIAAFALIREQQDDDLQLALIGRPKRGIDVLNELIKTNHLTDHVILTGYVPDEDMSALYRSADVFVYPSLYEGFGIPPLEAMMCGVPVVASNASSIPEVVGDASVLIDPESVESIANGIGRILSDTAFARQLIEKGYDRSGQFSWESTARQTLQVFEHVVNRK